MNIKSIKQIMKEVSEAGFTEFSYKDKEVELHFKKEMTQMKQESISIPVQESKAVETEAPKEEVITVVSPMVGTFYNAPSPEADVFVKPGDPVKKGQVIGIIEAMKLMNEITSDYEGTVIEVLVQNNQMVEYNQPLLTIKENK